MKPMLAQDFRSKVHMIQEEKLGEFFQQGYENYLPDDCQTGTVASKQLVDDFISYRKALESEK